MTHGLLYALRTDNGVTLLKFQLVDYHRTVELEGLDFSDNLCLGQTSDYVVASELKDPI